MDCAACGAKIETALRGVPDIADVRVSTQASLLTVQHHGIPEADIARRVSALGYPTRPIRDDDDHAGPSGDDLNAPPWWATGKGRLTIACGLALAAAYVVGLAFPQFERPAFLLALATGLIPIGRRAVTAALAGTPFSIETLMSIAAVGAVVIGATEEAALVVLLFLIGELLEGVAAGRARASIQGLSALVPKVALLERDGKVEQVPADTLRVGWIIVCRPGDRIPADGLVVDGDSAVDESPVTGESVPRRRGPGDAVFAGTINGHAVLRVRVTAEAVDNTIARVVRLVQEAQESKAPTERFIDRFSRLYTPLVVVVAALVAVAPPLLAGAPWDEWIYKGLALLLIGCPCALVISTPAAIAAGLSAGARRGLLIKGGATLESLGRITIAAFDKTGTLTEGRPRVTDVVPFGRTENALISMAAALESGSSHPLALAIVTKAKELGAPIPPAGQATALAGKGVAGSVGGTKVFLGSPQAAAETAALSDDQQQRIAALQRDGKTVSVVTAGGQAAGLIAMRDEPRDDAQAAVRALTAAGIGTLMVTGDNSTTAAAVAAQLGMDVKAELLPQDKLAIVRDLQAGGARVAKIGDGINDAPALAAADVGIAMGGGTDVALETADAAVLHGRVMDVMHMVTLSQTVMANIRQNIAIALGLKAVFLVTTIAGITGLWPAILADTGATVLVTANALRLLRLRF